MDGLQVAEQHDENCQADRCLRGGYGHDKKNEYLPRQILQVMRKGDEVDVDRQQHQFDGHQDDDQILPVQENTNNADRK